MSVWRAATSLLRGSCRVGAIELIVDPELASGVWLGLLMTQSGHVDPGARNGAKRCRFKGQSDNGHTRNQNMSAANRKSQ